MNFNKVNIVTGWLVCLVACSVYILTAEAGGSLWDCGEFVSSCFKLQVPHPPGAPMFVLLGRIFIIAFGDNPATAAYAVNCMSALASGFTILFLFWTITHFGRKIAEKTSKELGAAQIISVMGAGIVGALAYTFSDSFWYSAVEGEVYALSSFFTAIVFWAILKWENQADEPYADRWIVFIFFMMGVSIGVHLLNLLTIPAIVMVYYFRRRPSINYASIRKVFYRLMLIGGGVGFIGALVKANMDTNPERGVGMDSTVAFLVLLGAGIAIGLLSYFENRDKKNKEFWGGAYIFFVLSIAITGIVQVGVIQYTIKGAGTFDRWFVNGFGLPFFSGFAFFFIAVAVGIWYGLGYAAKKGYAYLQLGLWCLSFLLVGYSAYVTTMIRSSADPAVDMYNVDNPMSLVGYLSREQYGDFPILYGQKFTAQPVDYKETGTKYQKSKEGYIESGKDGAYVFAPEDKMIFPRMWDMSNDQGHADYYAMFAGIQKMQDKDGRESYERAPNFGDNFKYFIGYQNYFMYFRYFMWNFSGKQNDNQGLFIGNVRDGNWITGIGFIDTMIYGDQENMPDSLKNNKAHNKLYLLPFILGLIGLFYHFKRKGDDAFTNFLMFFFTGFAIVIYLNQAGYQPRERDYAYVGSFYAFAVWIGLGVLQITEWLQKGLKNGVTAGVIATGLCFVAVPALMANVEWDDHDRSKKVLARDLAKDYLEGCPPNAILFSFGDNDTYPLWYAQEVEGIRPDIRVVNTSLLGIDWYINQLRYKVNQSAPVDVILTPEQIEGRRRDYVLLRPKPGYEAGVDLYDMIKNYVGSNDPLKMEDRGGSESLNTFPTGSVRVPVNAQNAIASKVVTAQDSLVTSMDFTIPKGGLLKNDLAVLAIIAANQWKRPICFTSNYGELGFGDYLRRNGLSYELVPIKGTQVATDRMMETIMTKFAYGNANVPGVYYDEENRRHLNTIRRAHAELAIDLAMKGRKEEGRKVLAKADQQLIQENFAYGSTSRGNEHNRLSMLFLQACYMTEAKDIAEKVYKSVETDLTQQVRYYNSLSALKLEGMVYEKEAAERYLAELKRLKEQFSKVLAIPEMPAK